MVPLLALGVGIAVGLFLLGRTVAVADPRRLAHSLRMAGVGLGAVAAVFLALVGALGPALALGALLVPMIVRWRGERPPTQTRPGRTSRVETRYLIMELQHDSGVMTGTVRDGPFAGSALDDMDARQLRMLLADCRRDDPSSTRVLEAWLDRARPDWRRRFADQETEAPPRGGAMTKEEALEILGLGPTPTADEIRDAHRRLMMKIHPDHGGSTYLAAKINEAKARLLER